MLSCIPFIFPESLNAYFDCIDSKLSAYENAHLLELAFWKSKITELCDQNKLALCDNGSNKDDDSNGDNDNDKSVYSYDYDYEDEDEDEGLSFNVLVPTNPLETTKGTVLPPTAGATRVVVAEDFATASAATTLSGDCCSSYPGIPKIKPRDGEFKQKWCEPTCTAVNVSLSAEKEKTGGLLTTDMKMQCRKDSITMAIIIVPNVLSFLYDPNVLSFLWEGVVHEEEA